MDLVNNNSITPNKIIKSPLFILNIFRLVSESNTKIPAATKKLIKKYSKYIKKCPKSDIRNELIKIFSVNNSLDIINELDRYNILENIFPEIIKLKKSSPKYYFHPGGLWQHTKESLMQLEYILNNLKIFFPKNYKKIDANIKNHKWLLKLTILLHDIGKPDTVKIIEGRTRFFGHEKQGAKQAKKLLTRLCFSEQDIKYIQKLIIEHMRPGSLYQANKPFNVTERALTRFFRDIGNETIDLLLITLADRYSYKSIKGKNSEEFSDYKKFINKMIELYLSYKNNVTKEKPLINGNMVMKKFSLQPGPLIGKILKFVDEYHRKGKIKTVKQAYQLIRRNFILT